MQIERRDTYLDNYYSGIWLSFHIDSSYKNSSVRANLYTNSGLKNK
jgi:hypothetical protein